MNKTSQFLILLSLKILSIFISIGIPTIFIFIKICNNGTKIVPIIDVSVALFAIVILLVWTNWLKKVFYRKLQSIDTVEEMGHNTNTNFVIVRILKSIEYIFPFLAVAFLVKGISGVWDSATIYVPFFWLLGCLVGGMVIMIIHDGIKKNFTNLNLVEQNLEMKKNVEKLARKKKKLKMEVK